MWNSLCQIIADASRAEVWRMNTMREASAIGSAVIGVRGFGLGDFNYAKKIAKPERIFKPRGNLEEVFERKLKLLIKTYRSNRGLYKYLNKLS
jgi:sugar (pentulose or hexulose) kinase